jgi:hypothetical protein
MTFQELKAELKETHSHISLGIINSSNDERFPVYYLTVKETAFFHMSLGEVRIGRFESFLSDEDLEHIQINPALSNLKNIIG